MIGSVLIMLLVNLCIFKRDAFLCCLFWQYKSWIILRYSS
jgi:hypothetical protein